MRRKCLITCIQRGPRMGIVLRHRQLFCLNCLCSWKNSPGTIWPRDLARLTPWPATRTGAVCFSHLGHPETMLARPNDTGRFDGIQQPYICTFWQTRLIRETIYSSSWAFAWRKRMLCSHTHIATSRCCCLRLMLPAHRVELRPSLFHWQRVVQ